MWIDISHTVKAAELKGGRLEKHLHTGETRMVYPVETPFEEPVVLPEIVATTTQNRRGKKRGS